MSIKIQSTKAGGSKPIEFQNDFMHISPYDLEEIMEYLSDFGFLSEKGIKFRGEFWEIFIKKITYKNIRCLKIN